MKLHFRVNNGSKYETRNTTIKDATEIPKVLEYFNNKYKDHGGVTEVKKVSVKLLHTEGYGEFITYLADGESLTYEDIINDPEFKWPEGKRMFYAGTVSLDTMDMISEEMCNNLINFVSDLDNPTDAEMANVIEMLQEAYPNLREIKPGEIIKTVGTANKVPPVESVPEIKSSDTKSTKPSDDRLRCPKCNKLSYSIDPKQLCPVCCKELGLKFSKTGNPVGKFIDIPKTNKLPRKPELKAGRCGY